MEILLHVNFVHCLPPLFCKRSAWTWEKYNRKETDM